MRSSLQMTAILGGNGGYFKGLKLHFWTFLLIYFLLFQRNCVGTLLLVRGTLSTNLTSNDRDLRKWWPLSEITFLHFSPLTILVIPTKLGRGIARGKRHRVRNFDLKRLSPREMAAILKLHFWTFYIQKASKLHKTIFYGVW